MSQNNDSFRSLFSIPQIVETSMRSFIIRSVVSDRASSIATLITTIPSSLEQLDDTLTGLNDSLRVSTFTLPGKFHKTWNFGLQMLSMMNESKNAHFLGMKMGFCDFFQNLPTIFHSWISPILKFSLKYKRCVAWKMLGRIKIFFPIDVGACIQLFLFKEGFILNHRGRWIIVTDSENAYQLQ